MPTDQLYLSYSGSPVEIGQLDVKDCNSATIEGVRFNLAIIGNSHYITAPSLDFYELFSCIEPTTVTPPHSVIPIENGHTNTITHETSTYAVETAVTVKPLCDCPSLESADMSYRFEADAFTTLTYSSVEPAYCSCHTYPEYRLGVCTEQTLSVRDHDRQ